MPASTAEAGGTNAASGLMTLGQELNAASKAAGERGSKLPIAERAEAMNQFVEVRRRVGGIAGLLTSLQVSPDAPGAQAAQARLNELSAQLRELQQQYAALTKDRASAKSREEMIGVRFK